MSGAVIYGYIGIKAQAAEVRREPAGNKDFVVWCEATNAVLGETNVVCAYFQSNLKKKLLKK